jgi:predicted secreted protein
MKSLNLPQYLTAILLAIGLALTSNGVQSQPLPSPQQPPATGHQVHFSISASERVDNDEVEVHFQHTAQAASGEAVMQQINQAMQQALSLLKPHSELSVQTGTYQVHPVYNKQRLISHWQGQQSLFVTSQNLPGLVKILSQIEPHLNYQGMRFQLSEQSRQAQLIRLTQRALADYRQQAQRIANSFDAPRFQLLETRVHTQANSTPLRTPYLQAARAMSEAAAPALEAGHSELSIQVDGVLQLPLE